MSSNINGFINLGNTCYLNATLQLIFNIKEFNHYFISKQFLEELNNNLKNNHFKSKNDVYLIQQYYQLSNDYHSNDKKLLNTKNLLNSILKINDTFIINEQHDSQEMIIFLLDNIHEALKYEVDVNYQGEAKNKTDLIVIESINELSKILNKKYSIVNELFFGMFYSELLSNEDDTKDTFISKKYEHFNNLTLQYSGDSLIENLELFFKDELLDAPILNEKMNIKQKAYKTTKISNTPLYLFITLKKYDITKKSKESYEIPIDNLNFNKYCIGYDQFDCNYQLIGVICHVGSLNFGHYYSIIKKNNKWYLCNDNSISEFNIEKQQKMINKNAYVLLYMKNKK